MGKEHVRKDQEIVNFEERRQEVFDVYYVEDSWGETKYYLKKRTLKKGKIFFFSREAGKSPEQSAQLPDKYEVTTRDISMDTMGKKIKRFPIIERKRS